MRRALLFFFLLLAGCSGDPDAGSGAGSGETDRGPCEEGFAPIAGEAGCAPILPKSACAPGTMAQVGSESCAPVGATTCGAGFAADPSGWGCDAVLPASPCSGDTRERLGKTTCEPISDCSAAFPPPGATHFVSPNGAEDATHFRTIAAAFAAAPSGSVIAIDSGTYREVLTLSRSNVKVVGRCPAQVVLEQPAGIAQEIAIKVPSGEGIVIKNLRFRGYDVAISVLGAKAHLDGIVVDSGTTNGLVAGNAGTEVLATNVVVRGLVATKNQTIGVGVSHGAKLVVEDSVISGNEFANVGATKTGTSLTLRRTVVRDGRQMAGSYGLGVYLGEGASATIEDSAIVDHWGAGVNSFASSTNRGSLTMRRSVVRRAKLDVTTAAGRGIEASHTDVVLEGSTIAESGLNELFFAARTVATVSNTVLLGAPQKDVKDRGAIGASVDGATMKAHGLAVVRARSGFEVQGTGLLDLKDSLVVATREADVIYDRDHWNGVGVFVESKGSLAVTSSTVENANGVGLLVVGNVTAEGLLVRATKPLTTGEFGRGLSIQNGARAEIARSAFVDNTETGVIAMMADASLHLTGSTISGTKLDGAGEFGAGLLLGEANAVVEKTTVTGNGGIGVAVAASGGAFRSGFISNNAVGIHAQDGTTIIEGNDELDARALVVSPDTRFVGNASRVGGGVFVLPPALVPARKK